MVEFQTPQHGGGRIWQQRPLGIIQIQRGRLLLLLPMGKAGAGRRNPDPLFKAMLLQPGQGSLREPAEQGKSTFIQPSCQGESSFMWV